MIKCDKGIIELRGGITILETELTCILKSMRKSLADSHDESFADDEIDRCLRLSRMSDDDLDKELQSAKKNLAEKLMDLIMDL